MPTPTTFGAYVRAQRHQLGLPGYRVAAAAGITPGMVSSYENGRIPTIPSLVRLARALQVTPHELLDVALADSASTA